MYFAMSASWLDPAQDTFMMRTRSSNTKLKFPKDKKRTIGIPLWSVSRPTWVELLKIGSTILLTKLQFFISKENYDLSHIFLEIVNIPCLTSDQNSFKYFANKHKTRMRNVPIFNFHVLFHFSLHTRTYAQKI